MEDERERRPKSCLIKDMGTLTASDSGASATSLAPLPAPRPFRRLPPSAPPAPLTGAASTASAASSAAAMAAATTDVTAASGSAATAAKAARGG